MKPNDHSHDLAREAVRGYLRLVLVALGFIAVAMFMSVLQSCEDSSDSTQDVSLTS